MNKMILAVILFVLLIILGAFMHQRNEMRTVDFGSIYWEPNRPRLIAQDSVNKLLKVALSDSASVFKSGLNLKYIEHTLNQNAWVENAQTYVDIKGSVGVQITSKLPIVRVEGNSSYYLDASGTPFPLSKNQSVMVPIFYGNPSEKQCHLLVGAIQKIATDSFMSNHVIAYQWLPEGLSMEPRQHDYQIILGTVDRFENKVKNYKAFYAKMRDSVVLKTYKKVNLSFHGQVVCSK